MAWFQQSFHSQSIFSWYWLSSEQAVTKSEIECHKWLIRAFPFTVHWPVKLVSERGWSQMRKRYLINATEVMYLYDYGEPVVFTWQMSEMRRYQLIIVRFDWITTTHSFLLSISTNLIRETIKLSGSDAILQRLLAFKVINYQMTNKMSKYLMDQSSLSTTII